MRRENSYRELFSGIETPVILANGKTSTFINFDNGATTPPLKNVEEALKKSIEMYGSVHRGGQKAAYSSALYEDTKEKILSFFNVSSKDGYCIIYVKNTTEGLNLLANELCDSDNTQVLTSRMEHHANDLPWRKKASVLYLETDKNGLWSLEDLAEKLANRKITYVTLTGASNVTGYLTPIHEVAKLVHQYGAKLIVDAAQLVAHQGIDIKGSNKEEAIDFLVFSAHKVYAPFGTGAVIAKTSCLEGRTPFLMGGGAVQAVFDHTAYFKESPDKEEAGTPNLLGAVALKAALETLQKVGMQQVFNHEIQLKEYALKNLSIIPKIVLYGDSNYPKRIGVIPFNIVDKHHLEIAQRLSDYGGIAVRNGCFCAQPYVARLLNVSDRERYQLMQQPHLPQPGMVRVSFGLYNTKEEIDTFLNILEWIVKK